MGETSKEADQMEETIVKALGYEKAFFELSKALDYAQKKKCMTIL